MSNCPLYQPLDITVDITEIATDRKNCGTCCNWDDELGKCREEEKLKKGVRH